MISLLNKLQLKIYCNKIKSVSYKFYNRLLRSPIKDIFESKTIDIHSKGKFPSNVLSNFHESSFILDGVQIKSMEGFLQSLKTSDINLQNKICQLTGKYAKQAGEDLATNFDHKNIYWQGKLIDRYSNDYQNLLKRAYNAKFEQDPLFREALAKTIGKTLIHSIGKSAKEETILTEKEFINMLDFLRKNNIKK